LSSTNSLIEKLKRRIADPIAKQASAATMERLKPRLRAHRLRLDALDAQIREISVSFQGAEAAPFWGFTHLNNGEDGALVVNRYRSALAADQVEPDPTIVAAVTSDVGQLLFPSHDTIILPRIRAVGVWEPEESTYFRQHLREGNNVINVGANVGYTASVISEAVGKSGKVVAIEPEPLNFELLTKNMARNGRTNTLPIHAAAGDRTGTIELWRSRDNVGDHRTGDQSDGFDPLTVPLIRLDDLVPPDFPIKLIASDAQGFDHRIVAGALGIVDSWKPLVTVEYWPYGIRQIGDDPIAVLDTYIEMAQRIVVVDKGIDATGMSANEIYDITMQGKDHVTLALDFGGGT
jgi:FkbM family methyltransferase